jgi:dienelactone hydrolase
MTATLQRPTPTQARGRRVTQRGVFTAATAVALAHALDDAFVGRQPGLGLAQHAVAALIATVAALTAIWAFPRLTPALRAATAFSFGALAAVNGAMHVQHVRADGVARADLTGVLAFAAGLVLAGLAVVLLWRRRRWWQRLLAVPIAVLGSFFVLGPMAIGVIEVHKWREPVAAKPGPDYQAVSFRSSDDLKLTGWYRPSRNGAAVLLEHGGNGDRHGPARHAEMLAAKGYGVLLYDARGRGDSEGNPNGYGWDRRHDVDGALAFLKSRDDVEPGRIGALGLSTGADVLVDVATDHGDIKAIVADGTAAGSYEDWHRLRGNEAGVVPGWIMFKTMEVLSGDPQSPPLEDRIQGARQPILLISAGRAEEYEFSALYDRVAGPDVEHWNLPDATHTAAIRQARAAYEQRVTEFFARTLR